ncbi:MAG TPA: chemotaxis protein CheB [Kofleriaceae bacterium]|nr:chemotaxis protein CheB [Kofleriaceae bacterium]
MAVPALAAERRDLIVVGTSAGGIEALPRLLGQLPATFNASMVICMHLGAREDAQLVHILERSTVLPVSWAEQGEPFLPGHIYVAPPDTHLSIYEGHLRLSSGPRENFSRPSIDRLFRSAAAQQGARTIGVLLTGMMGDGVAGLVAIRDSGGRTIVQDPVDAEFSELPTRALEALKPDAKLRVDEMGAALLDLTQEVAPHFAPPREIVLEAEIDRLGTASPREMDLLGSRVQQMCPECGGPLWEIGKVEHKHWRCYLGHVVNARDLIDNSSEQLEAALWSAIRSLHERAATWDALARDAREAGIERVASDYAARASEGREQAELARKFMLEVLRRAR